MVRLENPSHFNLRTIMNSGQCFRIYEVMPNVFDVSSIDHWVRIFYDKENNIYNFDCDENEFSYWENYFDLKTDYQPFFNSIMSSNDEFLKTAAIYGDGMRILRQNYWETIISFIISQNNNIPRIKKSIERFCVYFGNPVDKYEARWFSFPTKEDVSDITMEDLKGLGLGYRDKYILNACTCSKLSLPQDVNQMMGIGPKVAACIELFGLHKMDSYPIDTWVRKIIDEIYDGNFDTNPYGGFEGFVQQLQFYYYRHLKMKGGGKN